MATVKVKGRKHLFENHLFEALTRTHISVPLSIFYGSSLIIILYFILVNGFSFGLTMLYFLGGLIVFSLTEYFAHRYLFHLKANTPRKEKLQYMLHGVHHEYPKDKGRLAMPPLVSITLAILFLTFYNSIMGHPGFIFGSGFMSGYASYLMVHYIVHAWKPPKNFFKILWINHAIHHYQNPNVAFGVSSPLWDVIFRTLPKKKK
ncbi:MAG: fatty acid hydroxylase [Bacteroidia bacterium]|nr:fatty acid hydroxylase [Bacteroidia bacterium]